jgi:2-amino-4-hydroxy-6-hydroxymethyldihydropteridine diphosphokinase
MPPAYIGIGSNIGNRIGYLKKALALLKEYRDIKVTKISHVYETEPVGVVKQRKFYNAVVKISTKYSPEELLSVCKQIEKKLKRKKSVKWGPRNIDADIILYSGRVVRTKRLTIPHKEMHKRLFVLAPLMDIAGNIRHPVLHKSIKKIIAEIGKEMPKKAGKI